MKQSVTKNTLYLTIASIGQKVIAFFYFTLIANRLDPEVTGMYFLSLSVIAIFAVVADWGLTPVLIREVAKDESKALKLVRQILGLKIPLILLGALCSILFAMIFGYEPAVRELIYVAVVILGIDSLSLTFFGVLRGMQNLRFEAVGIFIGQLITAISGSIFLLLGFDIVFLILALVLGSSWNALFSGFHVVRRLGIKILLPVYEKGSWTLLNIALAFALAAVFVKGYSYVDTVLLKQFLGNEAVGIYAIAYKITYAFQFLPLAFVGALYPALSELVKTDREKMRQVFEKSMLYMAVLAVPVVFGIASTADKVIEFFYPVEYLPAVLPLQILVFVLFFIFLDFPIGSLLNASDHQKTKMAIMGVTFLINLTANASLIPLIGISGASVSAIISFSFMFFAGAYYIKKYVDVSLAPMMSRVMQILILGIIMALIVLILKPFVHLIGLIIVGAMVYTIGIIGLRIIKWSELTHLRKSLK